MQDPLLCVSQLFNQDRDILGMKLHPSQPGIVTQSGSRKSEDCTRLLNMLEIQLVNVANSVGVDLNRCNMQPHTSGVLQFVSGLGARKAQHILKLLRQERLNLKSKLSQDKNASTYPVVANRLSLVTKCTLGRRVFINCAGFIKLDVDRIAKEIDEDEEHDSQSNDDEANYTEILDSTRIHPETYEWARKMAVDALDIDEENDAGNSANSMAAAVKEILENPKRLKDLDLEAFAAELARTGHGDKVTTLYNIRHELSSRYRDTRPKFVPMSDFKRFFVLYHETPETFYQGKIVTCRVIGITTKRPVKDQLDNANPTRDEHSGNWICPFCKRADFRDINMVRKRVYKKYALKKEIANF